MAVYRRIGGPMVSHLAISTVAERCWCVLHTASTRKSKETRHGGCAQWLGMTAKVELALTAECACTPPYRQDARMHEHKPGKRPIWLRFLAPSHLRGADGSARDANRPMAPPIKCGSVLFVHAPTEDFLGSPFFFGVALPVFEAALIAAVIFF